MVQENQRITLTKRLLKEALLRLLRTSTVDKVSITQLCSEASVNRGTFYRHYEYPRDVLLDIEKDFLEYMSKQFDYAVSPADKQQYFENMFGFMLEHADLIKIFIKNASDDDFPKMFEKLYSHNFLKGRQNHISNDFDEDSRFLLTTFYAGGIYFFLKFWLFHDIEKTPKELAALFVEISNKDFI